MSHALIGSASHWLNAPHFPVWVDSGSGYAASALVLATFCMGSMRWLRVTAIGSNVAFIFYAAVTDIRPVLVLHSILLPVNLFRLMQLQLAAVTARRLLVEPESVAPAGQFGEPHFLSRAVVADPGAALPLVEREQERVTRLLVAHLPIEAAKAAGVDPQEASVAAPHLLDAIDRFLAALIPGNPSPEQLRHMADLHSRNDLLRALHEALAELAGLIGAARPGRPAEVAIVVGEGLGAVLLHADEAARGHAPEDIELLLRTTQDRSALVERIRQNSVAGSAAGDAADYRAIYAITALYERAVWLLHRYAALLADAAAHAEAGGQPVSAPDPAD